jgi:uncharacterized membrane protein YjdF
MLLKKEQIPIFIVHGIALIIFTAIFILRQNYEFMIYVGVILAVMTLIVYTNKKVEYSNSLLWGLTIWSIMHMAGGGILLSGARLYDTMIFNLVGEPYNIFRYDQLTHIFGFAVATLLMYSLIKSQLKKDHRWVAVSIVVVMAGLGAGALNEVIEFIAAMIIPSNGVGGYENTALDLVSNAIGSVLALVYILAKRKT